jgi:hypothetical protein
MAAGRKATPGGRTTKSAGGVTASKKVGAKKCYCPGQPQEYPCGHKCPPIKLPGETY